MKIMGLQMGMTLEEVGLMYIGAFRDMFEEFKKWHNMNIKRQTFKLEVPEEEASLSDLR